MLNEERLVFWATTLVIYFIILGVSRAYEASSLIYHLIILSLPLYLLIKKLDRLGLVKGKTRVGIYFCAILLIFALISKYLWRLSLTGNLWYNILVGVILASISEEILHRGYLQPKLQVRFGSTQGLLLTALLFTLIHIPKYMFTNLFTPINLIQVFILGVLFGFTKDESNSTIYPIIAHGIWNFKLHIATFRRTVTTRYKDSL